MKLDNYENIELIIFDCDGVLIDSETISAKVLSKQFNKIGINIDSNYVQKNFVGHSYPKVKKHILSNFDINLEDSFEEDYRKELLISFENELKAIPGIDSLLKTLNIPICVATSSSTIRATKSLKKVGIYEYFEDNLFSAYGMGEKGKPAPDIYLLAAKKFDVKPENILVIEDSLLGIEGAKKAGMKIWHFTGASHLSSWDYSHKYKYKPDHVFKSMDDFLKYLPHLSKNI